MRPYKIIPIIFFSVISIYCIGQTNLDTPDSHIKIGAIPGLPSFKHLTKYEIRFDSLMQAHNQASLKLMLDGKAFIKGTSKGLIDSAIQEQKLLSTIRYEENRSRYEFQDFKNGQLFDKTKNESDLDSVGTQCSCTLDGDTLKIGMGIWVFGGFAFAVGLVDNKFSSSYWLDEHERKIFKLNNSDTLSDNMLIPIIEQHLILDSFPTYKLGQQLFGYLRFKTANYLRASDFEDWSIKDEYSDKNMDTMFTEGTIHFTCRVRQKFQHE
jgi:hypothetical protein